MRISSFLALATVTLFFGTSAMALSTDDKTMTNADGTAKFSDPDDQTPGSVFKPTANFNQQGSSAGSQGNPFSAAPFSPADQTTPRSAIIGN
jgi:hypothetical protein